DRTYTPLKAVAAYNFWFATIRLVTRVTLSFSSSFQCWPSSWLTNTSPSYVAAYKIDGRPGSNAILSMLYGTPAKPRHVLPQSLLVKRSCEMLVGSMKDTGAEC